MKVTKENIKHIANLAKLNVSDEELKSLTKDMTDIITYFEKLKELNTEDVRPMEHIKPVYNIFRKDKIKASFDRDEILKNAPDKKDGAVEVPNILD